MEQQKRSYYNCSVDGCLNSTLNGELSFFKLPAASERRNEWLRLIHREDLTDSSCLHVRVCEAHFSPDCVMVNSRRKLLKRNSFPQLLPLPSKFADKGIQAIIETADGNHDEDTSAPSDDSDSGTTLVISEYSTQTEKPPKRKREELAPSAVDPLEPGSGSAEAEASSKTEFDVFCEGLALQLNSMPLEDALRLQLELQTLVTQRRLQCLQEQQTSPLLPKKEPSSPCGSPI